MSVQNLNQTFQTPLLGQPDLSYNFNTKSALINPDSVATKLMVGQAVKLIAGAVPGLLVDQAASAEEPYGVIVYQLKKNTYAAGNRIEIACKGNVLYLESAAAITRGATVENVPSGAYPVVQTKASGAGLGICLDQASAAGQLVRIEIDPSAA